ncbi:MAG: VapC toxin family PIN domain ribonuclease, partial [Acidimicrobiia bacterium]
MRLYADTSALVAAYLDDEMGGHEYRSLLLSGKHVVATSVLTMVEFASAFHRAARAGRIRTPAAYIDRAEADCSTGG